ncbi:MAG: leucyl/phenylalanyl-tRNA--protein transferase [Alphaproteobacteria bacterium]|nr:leucyl/phenylalanyl-tRNA--protein transferase [Alphaproteobacteria bacterium]MBU0796529.1 leucyl/phenylalanyl-tRNA--protein transferase [Alphaproteobacteria bacterium]MBU0888057.1 leucyl/phenylalanyl-tRNA--protein transferase [Alphaproteobacteria bacterium]MBU1811502.1 leucyl/phenylalanyl-tRNA--protein transferase [Alphaproteobacteria bacterium]MBU2091586.1 leucyl/phenylalanyl-tRNA--protein transferase [Alphaproteobacteria bacterium]
MIPLTPELILQAYAIGVFPMAESRDDPELFFIDPNNRGILPLDSFHVPRSLAKTLRKGGFDIRCNTAFREVLAGCAESTENRHDTWINDEIVRLFLEFHRMGLAHSIETWRDDRLVGGLYGLAMGGTFFGESMFSRATDASKVALVDLVVRLTLGGFTLLDTQFVTSHLTRFGAIEIPREAYKRLLAEALKVPAVFPTGSMREHYSAFLQSITQTS